MEWYGIAWNNVKLHGIRLNSMNKIKSHGIRWNSVEITWNGLE